MHTYVINLARSVDRRKHIIAELRKTGLDYEIVPAIDGRDLDMNDASLIDPAMAAKCVFPGTVACPLSHLLVYKKVMEQGENEALVLEDDITLPADLGSIANDVAGHLTGAEVGLLNFGGYPPDPLQLSLQDSVDLPSDRRLALPVDARQLVNAGAYVITREACQRMLESAPPVRSTADAWGFFYEEGIIDRVRCVLPQPVPKCPKFESTIGMYSLGNGFKARLVGPLVRHKIPGLHQVIQHRRQRIMRHWDRSEVGDLPFVCKPSRLG